MWLLRDYVLFVHDFLARTDPDESVRQIAREICDEYANGGGAHSPNWILLRKIGGNINHYYPRSLYQRELLLAVRDNRIVTSMRLIARICADRVPREILDANDSLVRQVARNASWTGTPDRVTNLSILADALEEAGSTDSNLLAILRHTNPNGGCGILCAQLLASF